MLRSMTKKQIETSNNKLFGRLVDRLTSEFSIPFSDAVKAIFSTTAWQQILRLEEPVYYMDEANQYAVIVRELKTTQKKQEHSAYDMTERKMLHTSNSSQAEW
jgi:penicillin V acylase-like amidase (Ntn superfamily)